ncbi:unnamed protein product [Prunus armeniaca]
MEERERESGMDWGATVTALAMENGGGVGWWRRSGMGPGERLAKYKLKSVTRELQKPGSTKIPFPVHPSPAVRVGCESAVPEVRTPTSDSFLKAELSWVNLAKCTALFWEKQKAFGVGLRQQFYAVARMERTETIDNFKVGSLPTLIYIPDFITDNEQTMLLNKIYEAPVSKWKSLKNRRLQNWGGTVHEKGLLPQDLPSWLTKITYKIYEESGLFPLPINHVLINEYLPNQGIMAHQDGPAYYPVVAILSLRSPVVMDFTPHSRLTLCRSTCTNDVEDTNSDRGVIKIDTDKSMDVHHPFPVILMPRSLMIFKDKAYSGLYLFVKVTARSLAITSLF